MAYNKVTIWCDNSAVVQASQSKKNKRKLVYVMLSNLYPTALKGCQGIVFTHGVSMGWWEGRRLIGKSLSGLYL